MSKEPRGNGAMYARVLSTWGECADVARFARQSTGNAKSARSDVDLVRHLAEHGHLTVFERLACELEVHCPIFVARQWLRTRIATFCERSGRYSTQRETAWVPSLERCQGNAAWLASYEEAVARAEEVYARGLVIGLPRELARTVLPLSSWTTFREVVNARILARFVRFRTDSHAQEEIAELAASLDSQAASLWPVAWPALRAAKDEPS